MAKKQLKSDNITLLRKNFWKFAELRKNKNTIP